MSRAISARKRRKGPLAESRPHIPTSSEWDTILAKAENFILQSGCIQGRGEAVSLEQVLMVSHSTQAFH